MRRPKKDTYLSTNFTKKMETNEGYLVKIYYFLYFIEYSLNKNPGEIN